MILLVPTDSINIEYIKYEKRPFLARWIRIDTPEGTLNANQVIVTILFRSNNGAYV